MPLFFFPDENKRKDTQTRTKGLRHHLFEFGTAFEYV